MDKSILDKGLLIPTLTPRPGVYRSPGTSNVSWPLSTERRALCQDSTPEMTMATNLCGLCMLRLTYYYLLVWGAGLREPQQVAPGEEGRAVEDGWSEKWGLSHLRRCDVNHRG